MNARPAGDAHNRLLDAAIVAIRTRGFAATSVDELCRAAGVTKGAFFHHFASKAALGVAAAEHWSETTGALFAAAPYHGMADPAARVLAYVDFRKALLQGGTPDYTCLVGTMVQEVHQSHPDIRAACDASISGHAATLEADIAAALEARGLTGRFSAESLALFTQATIQGAFILAKARNDSAVAADVLDHLRRYLENAFNANTEGNGHD
ncbi:TetR/AcrR family transcriptional regulator [Minwuia thermotolerans]|uniref:TetR/AcrR family transcriptional regulator n=1 Tax=Minwuia thermotolerans TaxID=2056226 RepID=A0A2M9G5L5_9PROT|nr:TetR/AcrR family transcriptional regulator [Minwuia thermotolerans]PJK31001.1 TetR/AcrR family transcriptional regulator [Minwuia thermotolerans]